MLIASPATSRLHPMTAMPYFLRYCNTGTTSWFRDRQVSFNSVLSGIPLMRMQGEELSHSIAKKCGHHHLTTTWSAPLSARIAQPAIPWLGQYDRVCLDGHTHTLDSPTIVLCSGGYFLQSPRQINPHHSATSGGGWPKALTTT